MQWGFLYPHSTSIVFLLVTQPFQLWIGYLIIDQDPMRALFVLVFSLFTLFGLGQGYAGTEFRFAFMKNLNPSFNNTPSPDISIQALENAVVTNYSPL